jgi:hypothetical protein
MTTHPLQASNLETPSLLAPKVHREHARAALSLNDLKHQLRARARVHHH